MSQVHKSAIAQPVPVRRNQRLAEFETAAIALAAAAVASFLILTSLSSTPAGSAATGSGDLVDGWMPGAVAARAAQLQRLQDGYFPGLVAARSGGDLQDGYFPGLVAEKATSVNGGTSGADVTDGWESSLLP